MIYINSCGHDSHHKKACDIEHNKGVQDYLILLIKSRAWIVLNGEKEIIQPNSLICFPPNTYIHYGYDESGYNDDWIHFWFDVSEEDYMKKFLPELNVVIVLHNLNRLSEYVRMLSDNFHAEGKYKKESMDYFMRIILYGIINETEIKKNSVTDQRYYQSFERIRSQIYNDPANDWRIQDIANSICLSISYFQHLYKQFFNCSCQQDIILARLEQAKYYLSESDMSVKNIADFCGYENEVHFMRQFKKNIGVTPSEYRKR